MRTKVLAPGRNVRKKGLGWGVGGPTWLIMPPLPRPWPLWVTCTQTPCLGPHARLESLTHFLLSFLSCRQLFRLVTNLPNLGGALRAPRLPLNQLTDPRVSFLLS